MDQAHSHPPLASELPASPARTVLTSLGTSSRLNEPINNNNNNIRNFSISEPSPAKLSPNKYWLKAMTVPLPPSPMPVKKNKMGPLGGSRLKEDCSIVSSIEVIRDENELPSGLPTKTSAYMSRQMSELTMITSPTTDQSIYHAQPQQLDPEFDLLNDGPDESFMRLKQRGGSVSPEPKLECKEAGKPIFTLNQQPKETQFVKTIPSIPLISTIHPTPPVISTQPQITPRPKSRAQTPSRFLANKSIIEHTRMDESVGNVSTILPDTPAIRRHAYLLGAEHDLLRTPSLLDPVKDVNVAEDSFEFVKKGDESIVIPSTITRKKTPFVSRKDETALGDVTTRIALMGDESDLGEGMAEALGKVEMTMIGDETQLEIRQETNEVKMDNTKDEKPDVRSVDPAPVTTLAPPAGEMTMYETLDLKTALKRTSIMPKDIYSVGKDGVAVPRSGKLKATLARGLFKEDDGFMGDLMKEDNPFIATLEEKERASHRNRSEHQPKFYTSPVKQSVRGHSRGMSSGQSLRDMFAPQPSTALPCARKEFVPKENEVELELRRLEENNKGDRSRLQFALDLSEEGLARVHKQSASDEASRRKMKVWEDAKRWGFVLDNMVWMKKMQQDGLLAEDKLVQVLRIIYEQAPDEPIAPTRAPTTPTFVKDAKRLFPAQNTSPRTVRGHRRSATMDATQVGMVGPSGTRITGSTQPAMTTGLGHKRTSSIDASRLRGSGSPPLPMRARPTTKPLNTERGSIDPRRPLANGSSRPSEISRTSSTSTQRPTTSRTNSSATITSTLPATRTRTASRLTQTTATATTSSTTASALNRSRTRTSGTNPDQVLAAMGIRDPSRTTAARSSSTAPTALSGRTSVTAIPAARSSTLASSIMTGRTSTSSTLTAARTRMTQPSASGLTSRVTRLTTTNTSSTGTQRTLGTANRLPTTRSTMTGGTAARLPTRS